MLGCWQDSGRVKGGMKDRGESCLDSGNRRKSVPWGWCTTMSRNRQASRRQSGRIKVDVAD